MIIRANNNFGGALDISAPEVLDSNNDTPIYRGVIRPGETRNLPDEYYAFPNIRNAVARGFLVVISFDKDAWNPVIIANANNVVSGASGAGTSGYSGASGYSGISGFGSSGMSGDKDDLHMVWSWLGL